MRHGTPLNEYDLTDPIDTGISTSRAFIELQALRIWDADLDVLKQWKEGNLDRSLLKLAVSFYLGDLMYQNHRKDAVAIEQKIRDEKAKAKSKAK